MVRGRRVYRAQRKHRTMHYNSTNVCRNAQGPNSAKMRGVGMQYVCEH